MALAHCIRLLLELTLCLCFFHYPLVRAAVNLDGTHATEPATTENDPSPIDTLSTYYSEQHDCPLPCYDLANVHSWITYLSVDRLKRCNESMLLQLSTAQSLSDPRSTKLIRACTLSDSAVRGKISPEMEKKHSTLVDNPKLAKDVIERTIDVEPACAVRGKSIGQNLASFSTSSDNGNPHAVDGAQIAHLLRGMHSFFSEEDNCNERFLFAHHKKVVAGVYVGAGLGKPTIASALEALATRLGVEDTGSIHNQTTVEFCSSQRTAERTFGLVVDTTGNLAGVQDLALGWSQGKCSKDINGDIKRSSSFPGINIFDIAGSGVANNGTKANNTLLDTPWAPYHSRFKGDSPEALDRLLQRRDDTCNYMQVMPGDSLHSIAAKCGVATQALITHNSDETVYGPLEVYSYICCTSGKPFKPHAAGLLPRAASTCTTHIIKDGDTCDALAKRYSVTVANLEKWNKGKTWAWTECKNMLIEYNMCVSAGDPPLPPPQQGTACGPLVPGTKLPSSSSTSLADLNPCPLKACCSNWGFCGPFPAHCDIHAPAGGGPGTKLPGYQSTCVSNCGMEIKQNSGSPASFERIGYYESWNMGRDCLWQQAKDANTDGTYTIMHWGFVDIDPQTWKPILKDPHSQWSGFKALKNVKRVVSFGGWAYSTEPATYNIIRQAIINNRETFASRLAQFVADENIDGIDIDWEYPGAPDILVNGKPIGEDGDGVAYLKFLSTLKQKMAKGKTVSIAAPASYWYLKAFPIDRIASTIDYIVYMTYDLHGQWDYGNPNAFDQCDSGKCIRSHINVTETRNSLALITKAGVPNNKIFVGESSYGRSFRMAREGCWGPMCEFTGSRIVSNARPGRCTATGGYLANAEIEEILKYGNSVRSFKDPNSDSDILLYGGDYVSYMSLRTKIDRRNQWKGLNFAGTIDWAVDLQRFSDDDLDNITPGKDDDDTTCVSGEDISVESEDLCQFSCSFGFCPAPLCHCSERGKPSRLPKARDNTGIIAWDESDAGLGRLCRFACKYGYCPKRICGTPVYEDTDEDGDKIEGAFDYKGAREQNAGKCLIFKDSRPQVGVDQCRSYCSKEVEQAEDEGLYANWGCGGVWPLDKPLPWQREFGGYFISGNCSCNNWLVNELAETVVEALPKIFQIGCQIFMSAIYLVVKIGLEAFPAGRAINAGLDMAATGAQTINYLYDKDNDPLSAFDWWILKTCGDTSLVPDEIKDVFDTLNQVVDGISFKTPKNLRKGSGKKGDNGNPPTKDRNPPPKQPPKTGPPPKAQRQKKCVIKPAKETVRLGAALNTLRVQSCSADMTIASDMVITELPYVAAPTRLPVTKTCSREYGQACMHYSSAIDVNPEWETLTCPHASRQWRQDGSATDTWKAQHTGAGWLNDQARAEPNCDRDEYPPAYLQGPNSPSFLHSGKNSKGQLIRFLPRTENQAAGSEWKSMCFRPALERMSNADFTRNFKRAVGPPTFKREKRIEVTSYDGSAPGTHRAELSWVWEHDRNPGGNHGLSINPCWPRNLAALDPGFTLLTFDPYYQGAATPYNYKRAHVQGANGS